MVEVPVPADPVIPPLVVDDDDELLAAAVADINLARFDATTLLGLVGVKERLLRECDTPERRDYFFAFAGVVMGEGQVVRESLEETVDKLLSFWHDYDDLQLSADGFPTTMLTYERLLVEDVQVSLEMLVAKGVVQNRADGVPPGVIDRLDAFVPTPDHPFCGKGEKIKIVRHMWNLFVFWLKPDPESPLPSPDFVRWIAENSMFVPDTDLGYLLTHVRGSSASVSLMRKQGIEYLNRLLESPHLWSVESLRSPEFRRAVPLIANVVFEMDPADFDDDELVLEVADRARASFYLRMSATELFHMKHIKDLRCAFAVSGAAELFGSTIPVATRQDLILAIASMMYYKRKRATDLLNLLKSGKLDPVPPPVSVEDLTVLRPDPSKSYWRPLELPLPGAPGAEGAGSIPDVLPRPPHSGPPTTAAAVTQRSDGESETESRGEDDHDESLRQRLQREAKLEKRRLARANKRAAAKLLEATALAQEQLDVVDRETLPPPTPTCKVKPPKRKSVDSGDDGSRRRATKKATAASRVKAARALAAGTGRHSAINVDTSDREDPDLTASPGTFEGEDSEGDGDHTNLLDELEGAESDHEEENLLDEMVQLEHEVLAGIAPDLDRFDAAKPPATLAGTKSQRAYVATHAALLKVGMHVVLARGAIGPHYPPATTSRRPTFDQIGKYSQAVYSVQEFLPPLMAVRRLCVIQPSGEESGGVIPWPANSDVLMAVPQSNFLSLSSDMVRLLSAKRGLSLSVQPSAGATSTSSSSKVPPPGYRVKPSWPVGKPPRGQREEATLSTTGKSYTSAASLRPPESRVTFSPTVSPAVMMQPSKAVVMNPFGMSFQVYKSPEQQMVIYNSLCLCAFVSEERFQILMGSTEYSTIHLRAESFRKGGDRLFHQQAGTSRSSKCPVWSLNLFLLNDAELEEKAVYLLFSQYRNLDGKSLHLWHFLRRSAGREIRSHAELRQALEGLEEFLELFYDWPRCFEPVLRALKSNQLERFTVEYISMEIYAALCWLRETAEGIHGKAERLPPAEYHQQFVEVVDEIVFNLTKPGEADFQEDCRAAQAMQADGRAHSDDETPATKSPKRTKDPQPPKNAGDKNQLCVADAKFRSKLVGRAGTRHAECAFGDACLRTHMSELNGTLRRTDAARQVAAVIGDKKLAADLTAWLEKQPGFQ